jgi:hypothetical protein
MEGIVSNADQRQDNVLIEYLSNMRRKTWIFFNAIRYEAALLLNKLYDVPVFPIFLAEIVEKEFVSFTTKHAFPEVPHNRNKSSQRIIDSLRYLNAAEEE